MLIFSARQTGPAICGEAVEAHEHVGLDELAHGITLNLQGGLLRCDLALARTCPLAGFIEGRGQQFDLGASRREHRFLLLGAFEASELFVVQTINLLSGEVDLVLNGVGLGSGSDGVTLRAKPFGLLAMLLDVSLEPGAQRLLTREGVGGSCGIALSAGESLFGLAHFHRQSTCRLRQAGAFQLKALQLHQVFNQLLHPWWQVYHFEPLVERAGTGLAESKNGERTQGTFATSNPDGAGALHHPTGSGGSARVANKPGGALADGAGHGKRKRRWLVWTAAIAAMVVAGITITLAVLAHHVEPFLRAVLIQGLQNRFQTRVELDDFHVRLGNGLHGEWGVWATGKGLRIWPPRKGGGDHPLEVAVQSIPLIELQEFRFHAPVSYKTDKPIRISMVRLTNLQIHIPPRSERDNQTGFEAAGRGKHPTAGKLKEGGRESEKSGPPESGGQDAPAAVEQPQQPTMLSRVQIERIECDHTLLELETDKPNKLPTQFEVVHLHITNVKAFGSMHYEADVVNPRPKGTVHTLGELGPWKPEDPGLTTLSGTFRFPDADLSVFKGIAGILNAEGRYSGTLRDLAVEGQADVPNFSLTHFGNAMPLHTKFHAHVDGSDGDTWLDHVDAVLGQSHFTTMGKIVRVRQPETPAVRLARESKGIPAPLFGHDIELKVNVDRGRMEDFLHLASRSPTPILNGALALKAALSIPPGPEPVHKRLKVDGEFSLDEAHFTSPKIKDKIRELSMRGQGHPGAVKSTPDDVASAMRGEFHLAHAVILFPDLEYDVPGAAVRLKGNYELDGLMGFNGTARMQATVSQMVGGWKGFLLKPADRFFRKNGAGTEVSVEIRGSHDSPQFSFSMPKGNGSTHPQRPDQRQN